MNMNNGIDRGATRLMNIHIPPHPGEFIREAYIVPYKICVRKVAESLDVSTSTLDSLLNGQCEISPELAQRLSSALGRSPDSWLEMQNRYDRWRAGDRASPGLREVNISAA